MHQAPITSLDRYIESKIREGVFPKGTTKSIPLVTQKGDRLFYAIFFYDDIILEHNLISRPFAWALLPILQEGKQDFAFNFCSVVDFVNSEAFPENYGISANTSGEDDSSFTREMFINELGTLIIEIAQFAFREALTDFQQDILVRFKELFILTTYIGLYPFYDAIAQDFLNWINLTLIAKTQAGSIKEEVSSDNLLQLEAILPELNIIKNKLSALEGIESKLEKLASDDIFEIEKEIILVIDHINKSIANTGESIDINLNEDLTMIRAVKQDLIDLLYRHNIEPFRINDNNIDLYYQRVIQTRATNDESLNRTVCERLSKGWKKGERIVRAEHVIAYLIE